jgi:hypothetical protein
MFYPAVVGPLIPGANEPIDMDGVFLVKALGPAGERVVYYALDITTDTPARAFEVVDASGAPIEGQLPIVETLPEQTGYNDFLRIHEVRVDVADYRANQIASVADVQAAESQGAATVTPTSQVVNWAMVPAGTIATRNFAGVPVAGYRAWHDRDIAHYLLFETDLVITQGGKVPSSDVMVIFENGMDPTEGFAVEPDGQTHNVFRTLPGQPRYSSSWAHQVGSRAGFDSVMDWDSAEANFVDLLPISVNCPVVDP